MALSVASRLMRPVLRLARNTTRKRRPTSRVISCRIASTVFFQLRFRLLLQRPQTTDLRVGSQKLTSELPEFPELLHFSLGFLDRRRGGQCLRDRFTIELIGEPEIGAVARLTGLMAVTPWLTAPTRGARNAAGAKIAEFCDALSKHLTSLF